MAVTPWWVAPPLSPLNATHGGRVRVAGDLQRRGRRSRLRAGAAAAAAAAPARSRRRSSVAPPRRRRWPPSPALPAPPSPAVAAVDRCSRLVRSGHRDGTNTAMPSAERGEEQERSVAAEQAVPDGDRVAAAPGRAWSSCGRLRGGERARRATPAWRILRRSASTRSAPRSRASRPTGDAPSDVVPDAVADRRRRGCDGAVVERPGAVTAGPPVRRRGRAGDRRGRRCRRGSAPPVPAAPPKLTPEASVSG